MPVGLLRNESTAAGSGMYCANQGFVSMPTQLNHSPRVLWQPSGTIPLYVLPRLIEMARPTLAGPVQLRPVGPGVLGSTLYGNAPSDSEPSVVVGRRATVAVKICRCTVSTGKQLLFLVDIITDLNNVKIFIFKLNISES